MPQVCELLRKNGFCARAGCPLHHPLVCGICDGIQVVQDPQAHHLTRKHLRAAYNKGIAADGWCKVCAVFFLPSAYGFIQHSMGRKHAANSSNDSFYAALEPTALRQCFPCNRLIQHGSFLSHTKGQTHRSKAAKRTIPLLGSIVPELNTTSGFRNIDLGNVDPHVLRRIFTVPFTFSDSATVLDCQLSGTNAGLASQNP